MTGFFVPVSNSDEFASFNPSTFRANSIVAICIPRHIPRNGIPFSLAYFVARIFPSVPLCPNPPGTNIPSAWDNLSSTVSGVISPLSVHKISTLLSVSIPACLKASATDR